MTDAGASPDDGEAAERAAVEQRLTGLLTYLASLERIVEAMEEAGRDAACDRLMGKPEADTRQACFWLRQAATRLQAERDALPPAACRD